MTDLALRIDESFSEHPGTVKVDDDNFVFYCKMSSAIKGLKVEISLLDENGKLCSRNLPRISINTNLVYEDGFPVQTMPMKPLKMKARKKDRGVVRSQKPIYECLSDQLWLGEGKQSDVLIFTLNEVTYHHHGHDGFKIRACVEMNNHKGVVVHPAVLKPIITVLSKPRKVETTEMLQHDKVANLQLKLLKQVHKGAELVGTGYTKAAENVKKRRGLSTVDEIGKKLKDSETNTTINRIANTSVARNRSDNDENNKPIDRDGTLPPVSAPIMKILDAYKIAGKCAICYANIGVDQICRPEYHSTSCAFVDNLLPLLQHIDLTAVECLGEEGFPESFQGPILESESFEECSKEYIANTPCEAFDTSIFSDPDQSDTTGFHIKRQARRLRASNSLWNFNEDDIISGENIFGLRAESLRPLGDSDQDNGIAADAYNEAGDFLNFLDHVARGEQHYIG